MPLERVAMVMLPIRVACDANVHLMLEPWSATDDVYSERLESNGVIWKPSSSMLSYGPDPATSIHSMLAGIDVVRGSNKQHITGETAAPDLWLRLNFTNDHDRLRHWRNVLKQTFAYRLCGRCNTTEMQTTQLQPVAKMLAFLRMGYIPIVNHLRPHVQLLLPLASSATPSRRDEAISEYLLRQIVPIHVEKVFGCWSSMLREFTHITFQGEDMYITDHGNHRILKVRVGSSVGEVFFGGRVRGDDLTQLQYPAAVAFYKEAAYIVDTGNNRVLKLMPGSFQAEIFFGGKSGDGLHQLNGPESITFHEHYAYIVDSGNDRVLKAKAGSKADIFRGLLTFLRSSKPEIFFGGRGRGDDITQLRSPSAVSFHAGKAYIVDRGNNRVLKVLPGSAQGEVFFGGKGEGSSSKQLKNPSGIFFHNGFAYITDRGNGRVMKIAPGSSRGKVFVRNLQTPSPLTGHGKWSYIAVGWGYLSRVVKLVPHTLFGMNWMQKKTVFGGKHQVPCGRMEWVNNPDSFTIHRGKFYIVDTSNNRVVKFSPGSSEAEVFLGWGSGLDHLQGPSGIVFKGNDAYITDTGHGRVLKISLDDARKGPTPKGRWKSKPMEGLKIFFQGRGTWRNCHVMSSTQAMAFHKEDAYIIDACENRVLKVRPGASEGELFFAGNGQGKGLNQLDFPKAITFHRGKAYITDASNNRVLQVTPGSSHGKIFFGGKRHGSALDQLSDPEAIVFHQEDAYIVDSGNHRVLKVARDSSHGELFFGGKGKGIDLNQLARPTAIAFQGDSAYILDQGWNRGRILKVSHRHGQVLQYQNKIDFASAIRGCSSAVRSDEPAATVFVAQGPQCNIRLSKRVHSELLSNLANAPAVSEQVGNIDEVNLVVAARGLDLPRGLFQRKLRFFAIFLVPILPSCVAHASGSTCAHVVFLGSALCFSITATYLGFMVIPFVSWHAALAALGCLLAVCLPWLMVPLYLYLAFGSLTQDSFSSGHVAAVSCPTGVSWELHCFTLVAALVSASIWALVLKDNLEKARVEKELPQLPPFVQNNLPRVNAAITTCLASHKQPFNGLMLLVEWTYCSMGDQYLDLTACLVMQACGYEFAWVGLALAVFAIVLQNLGGAIFIMCTVKDEASTAKYAMICLTMAAPLTILNKPLLEPAEMYKTTVRVVGEDLPQLLNQAVFTWLVYKNWSIIFTMVTTLWFARKAAQTIIEYYEIGQGYRLVSSGESA